MKTAVAIQFIIGALIVFAEDPSGESKFSVQERKIREYAGSLSAGRSGTTNDAVLLINFANAEGISTNALCGVMKKIAEEASVCLENEVQPSRFETKKLFFMAADTFYAANDTSMMPFLESKLHSPHRTLRHYAAITYLRLLGFSDLVKYREIVSDESLYGWERANFFNVWRSLIRRTKKADPGANLEKVYKTLLILAETEKKAPTAIDDVLCEVVDGYAASIQRIENLHSAKNSLEQSTATHDRKADGPYANKAWQMIDRLPTDMDDPKSAIERKLEAMEKIPKEKRVDLRQRYKTLSIPDTSVRGG